MRIAVASSGRWLDSIVDLHAGRAACFILYDTDQESFKVIDNLRCTGCKHWAGSHTANNLIESKANAVIVRNIGPNTFNMLITAKIDVCYVDDISVAKAVKRFREGKLSKAKESNCDGHSHLHQ